MLRFVRPNGTIKKVGKVSEIVYASQSTKVVVGETVEIQDLEGDTLNIAQVTSVEPKADGSRSIAIVMIA